MGASMEVYFEERFVLYVRARCDNGMRRKVVV
jgi:hypothetical protein